MKKKVLIIQLFIVFSAFVKLSAQDLIELQSEKFSPGNNKFYIQEIIDSRKNKGNIGYKRNLFDEKVYIDFKNGIHKSLKAFVDLSLPPDTLLVPVIMKVCYLNVLEENVSLDVTTGRAEVKIEFYIRKNKLIGKIYEIEHFEDESFKSIEDEKASTTHERRIRAAIEFAIKQFSVSGWKNSPVVFNDLNTVYKEASISQIVKTENTPLLRWNNTLSYGRRFSKHMEGWRISYSGFNKSKKDKVILPFIFSYDKIKIKPESLDKGNYVSTDYYTFSFGTHFYYELLPALFANISIQVPLGLETVVNRQNEKLKGFLIGVNSTQGLLFIPKSEIGIVLGVNAFVQLQTSRIYKTNIGIEFEIGIKF